LKNPSHALRVSHTHGTKKRKLMLELWKVVPDYPNYKISSFGRVEKHGKISDFAEFMADIVNEIWQNSDAAENLTGYNPKIEHKFRQMYLSDGFDKNNILDIVPGEL